MSGSLHAIRYEIVILQTMAFEAQGRPIMPLPLPALGKPVRFPVSVSVLSFRLWTANGCAKIPCHALPKLYSEHYVAICWPKIKRLYWSAGVYRELSQNANLREQHPGPWAPPITCI